MIDLLTREAIISSHHKMLFLTYIFFLESCKIEYEIVE